MQITDISQIAGKTINVCRTIGDGYDELLLMSFFDGDFVLFEGTGYYDGSSTLDICSEMAPEFRLHFREINDMWVTLGLRTQAELDQFYATAEENRVAAQKQREYEMMSNAEKFPTLVSKGVLPAK